MSKQTDDFMNKVLSWDLKPKVIDPYKLPPISGVFKEGPIQWVLNQAESPTQRKYYAAKFILGQPFNQPLPQLRWSDD